MPARAFVFLLILLTSCATRDASEQRVRLADLHRQRFEAMVVSDMTGLHELLAEDLVYVHSDGTVETKQEFIEAIRGRKMRYRSIQAPDPLIRIYGDSAVVTGRGTFAVTRGGADQNVDLRYTAVYRRTGSRWQLVSWQSTRVG